MRSGAEATLTTLVEPVDAGDVVLTHVCGRAKAQAGIALGDDGVLAVFGEGGAS